MLEIKYALHNRDGFHNAFDHYLGLALRGNG